MTVKKDLQICWGPKYNLLKLSLFSDFFFVVLRTTEQQNLYFIIISQVQTVIVDWIKIICKAFSKIGIIIAAQKEMSYRFSLMHVTANCVDETGKIIFQSVSN